MTSGFFYLLNKENPNGAVRASYLLVYVLIWSLFVGGQYGVGADYHAYNSLFKFPEGFAVQKTGEFVFFYILVFSKYLFDSSLATFFLLAFLSGGTLVLISRFSVSRAQQWLFFFLFITVSTAFNNQFNAIRQYLSAYVLTFAFLLFLYKNYKISVVLFLISSGIHSSAVWAISILFILYLVSGFNLGKRVLVLILIFSAIPVLFLDTKSYVSTLMELSGNTHYLNHKYFKILEFDDIILKLFNLLFYILLLLLSPLKIEGDSSTRNRLYVVGILAYAVKMLSLASTVSNRFGMFFEVLMILPLVYALNYWFRKNSSLSFFVLCAFFFVYFLKVTFFASGEYVYDSVFLY